MHAFSRSSGSGCRGSRWTRGAGRLRRPRLSPGSRWPMGPGRTRRRYRLRSWRAVPDHRPAGLIAKRCDLVRFGGYITGDNLSGFGGLRCGRRGVYSDGQCGSQFNPQLTRFGPKLPFPLKTQPRSRGASLFGSRWTNSTGRAAPAIGGWSAAVTPGSGIPFPEPLHQRPAGTARSPRWR